MIGKFPLVLMDVAAVEAERETADEEANIKNCHIDDKSHKEISFKKISRKEGAETGMEKNKKNEQGEEKAA
jgi:hypothetical protein